MTCEATNSLNPCTHLVVQGVQGEGFMVPGLTLADPVSVAPKRRPLPFALTLELISFQLSGLGLHTALLRVVLPHKHGRARKVYEMKDQTLLCPMLADLGLGS